MGDDIGNIIYVVVILLSLIFSAFKKKKKPVAPPVPQQEKKRPSFDPLKELETFLEMYDDKEQKPIQQEVEIPEVLIKEDYVAPTVKEEQNTYMEYLEDERFQEAVPQTFSEDKLYSDDIKDIAPPEGSDNIEFSTERTFDEQIQYEKDLKRRCKVLKNFNVKDAVIYSVIINRPYQ